MLYVQMKAFVDSGHPCREMAKQMIPWFNHPSLRYHPMASTLAATCELVSHSAATHTRPDYRIAETVVKGQTVAVTEEVLLKHPFCNLIRFRKHTNVVQPVVLLVAPLSGHFATLLRDTIETCLPDYDVYVTDWLNARDIPVSAGEFGVDDSIDVIMKCLQFLGSETHAIAVCQPAVTLLAAVALLAQANDKDQPKSMILMGGPIDTRINPTKVNEFATAHSLAWFEQNVISRVPRPCLGVDRKVYPGLLQLVAFLAMNQPRHLKAQQNMFWDRVQGDSDSAARPQAFYDEYSAVMDLTAEFYLETLTRVFMEHHLPQGRFLYRENLVVPAAIARTACMIIEGEKDDICGIGQTQAALPLLTGLQPSQQHYHLQSDVGHYGLFNGGRWRKEIYPAVRRFIQASR